MISVDSFYGNTSIAQLKIEKILNNRPSICKKPLPCFLNSLLSPSRTWRVFRKQEEAIRFAHERKNNLMTYAFQHSVGERSFLVCHPIVLWYVYLNRPLKERCSYEVIPERSFSKLYLDLEFDYKYNPCYSFTNGEGMIKTIIRVFINFLKEEMDIPVDVENFLDLDSSSDEKFSRHVILNIPNIAFANNHAVGNIVKHVCFKIQHFVFSEDSGQFMLGASKEQLKDLFIVDRKGVTKILVDLSVYSRNRHFRLLGSTKLFKNLPLEVSSTNKFKACGNHSHSMFISSLITHFDYEKLSIVNFGSAAPTPVPCQSKSKKLKVSLDTDSLDKFILQLVLPLGGIRQKSEVRPGKVKYDIFGFRYCHNIKRAHKSNNIFYIVDLERLFMYQSCYDPECMGFMSECVAIPANVIFSKEEDAILINTLEYILSDDALMEFINCDKNIFSDKYFNIVENQHVENGNEFPEMDLTDNDLFDIVTYSEYVL